MSRNTINITLSADVQNLNFFSRGVIECLYCIPAGFPLGSKCWHVSPPPSQSTVDMNCPQYGAAASVPMVTWPSLCVCVCQDMGMWDPLVKHTSCNIQEPIQLQAQCQPSYSVQLTTNEQFNTCPHAQHSKPCSVLYITDKSLLHFWNIPQLLAHSQYGANLLPLPL